MNLSSAYFLAFHGSRNREAHVAASKLRELTTLKIKANNIITQQNYLDTVLSTVETKIASTLHSIPAPLVGIAPLELGVLSLHESLVQFARTAARQGFNRVKVSPLFLAPGVHVTEDIPSEIALAIKQINNQVTIELSPYLGKYSGIEGLLSEKFARLSSQSLILVAHGSRLPQVTRYYQTLAKKLNASLAYWSISPHLSQQIETQIAAGHNRIGIVPYFLFAGKITRAIAAEVEALQEKYPGVEIVLGQPLGATEEVAELIAKEI